MKRLLKPLIYGIVACAVAWALVVSTNSGFGPCNPTGPVWWILMLLVMPGAIVVEAIGLKNDFLGVRCLWVGPVRCCFRNSVGCDVLSNWKIKSAFSRNRAISTGKNRIR